MTTTADRELTELLDRYDERAKLSKKGFEQAVAMEEDWVSKFVQVRQDVIRPTLQSLGEQIRAREHDYTIDETQFQRGRGSAPRPDEASIKMTIFLASERTRTLIGEDRRPYISFITHHRSERVHVHISDLTGAGGETVKDGEYVLNQISAFFVREKFIELFRKLTRKL